MSIRTLRLGVLALALVVRLPLCLMVFQQVSTEETVYQSVIAQNSDQNEYLRLAENIISVGQYSSDIEAPYDNNLKRVPGYPIVLAILFVLGGMEHQPFLILSVNLLLSIINVWLLMIIARRLFDERTALVATTIYALAPITSVLVTQALSETLFTTLLMLSVLITIVIQYNKLRQVLYLAFLLGICVALATYVRAIGLYILPILLLALFVKYLWHSYFIPVTAICGITFMLLLLPWYIYNYNAFGVWKFSSVADGNLMTYNAASVYAYRENISLREAKDELIARLDERLQNIPLEISNEATFNLVRREIAMGVLTENIFLTVWVHIRDSMQIFRPGYSMMNTVLEENPTTFGNNIGTGSLPNLMDLNWVQILIFGYMTLYYGILYLLTIVGVVVVFARRQIYLVLLLLALPYWFAFIPSIAGNSRFRVPIEGFMALVAALALLQIYDRFRREAISKFNDEMQSYHSE